MEDDERGPKLSKRFENNEVDFKTKSGTAWSHNFLNQKPWHPLSYPNQRRKWIAEQTHAQRQRRAEELAREYSQEQEFLRQTSLLSHKEKEKVDIMQAVSFMYVRPPGYNAESAKAAEVADERKKFGDIDPIGASSSSVKQEALVKDEKKKARPTDVFGRTLPTEEEFAVLKNAPRLETGVTGRVKPFAVEVRNVKCVRCGNFGHQSGDRECPLKDAIMQNDESRLKRDDPLTAIMAQMDPSEPLKWELKQKPGISPPRGGFQPDDPNQQIVAEEIFDEYGGFLSGGNIPELLTSFNSIKRTKKSKNKGHESNRSTSNSDHDKRSLKMKSEHKRKKQKSASHRRIHEGTSPTSDCTRYQKFQLKCSSKHEKHTSHQYSDQESDSTYISDHDKRSPKMKSEHKRKKQKSASHRQSHEGSSPTSDCTRYQKFQLKCSSKRKKHTSYQDSDQESDSTSDDHKPKRRSRKNHSRNMKRTYKELSHPSTSESEDSVDDWCRRKSQHKHSNELRHRKSKVMPEDDSSGGDRKFSRPHRKKMTH